VTTATAARNDVWITSTALVAVLVFVGALYVRGVDGEAPVAVADRPREPEELAAPMQLLGASAYLRAGELAPRIRESLREEWRDVQRFTSRIADCPPSSDWIASPAGQRFERLVGELRRGSREEALAALHLVFEVARRTEWAPGLRARTQHADKLAGLFQEWLRAWGPRAAEDTLLSEPAVAATLAYGGLMRRVSQPLPLGGNDEALERARTFLTSLLQDAHGQSTRLAAAVRARHPLALEAFGGKRNTLEGFARAFEQAYPELKGECGR
jgi:hypothetical protein